MITRTKLGIILGVSVLVWLVIIAAGTSFLKWLFPY